jgi:CTP:molybdopterin cytidylyltransferase MocA
MPGIVLGAGTSSRLGRPKQTLPLGDTTLLGWVTRNAEASALDEVVLVVGGAADEALAGLQLRRARASCTTTRTAQVARRRCSRASTRPATAMP